MLKNLKEDFGKALYGMTANEAREQGICIRCKEPIVFQTEADIREYAMSALCSKCWDEITKGDE